MNAKLFILAILTAVILALFMNVSAPAPEAQPDFRMTLGGDCSADRATGDLYHPVDPYCLVAEGPAAPGGGMAPNGPGAGYDDKQDNATSNAEVDEPSRKQEDDSSSIEVTVPITAAGPDDPAIQLDPPIVTQDDGPGTRVDEPGKDRDNPGSPDQPEEQVKKQPRDHPEERNNDEPDEHVKRQPKDDPEDRNIDRPKDKDDGPKDKQCKKDGRDNVNSQGNHDCSADNPDPHSGQERTTDHGQNGNSSNDQAAEQAKHKDDDQKSPDKQCKNADRDNVNSQGNHDCSADNPDTNSDQQLTTDHGPSEQAPGNDHGNKKEKKD